MAKSTMAIFVPNVHDSPQLSLLQFISSWDEGRVVFCWLRAQPPQCWSIGTPPGICHILTTLHAIPKLELADPLPIFPPVCGSALHCPSPWEALLPDICSKRAWWGMLTQVSCTPWSKFATLSEVDFFLNTVCPKRTAQRMVQGGRLHSKT